MSRQKRLAVQRLHNAHNQVDYQALEPRNLLASFIGTTGDDVIVVSYLAGAPRTVEINGVVHDNLDSDADIELLSGHDSITFVGQSFNLTVVGASDTVQGTGAVDSTFDFQFTGRIDITTSDQADTFDLTGGDRQLVGSALDFTVTLNAMGGSDSVNYHDGSANVDLGDGDDQFTTHIPLGLIQTLDGGEGFDSIEKIGIPGQVEVYRLHNEKVEIISRAEFGYGFGFQYNIEKYIAPDPLTLSANMFNEIESTTDPEGNDLVRGLNFVVEGDTATSNDAEISHPFILENYNKFQGGFFQQPLGGVLAILATDYPLQVDFYSRVHVGFTESPQQGDTSSINHPLKLNATTIAMSDFLGPDHDIFVDRVNQDLMKVEGLTPVEVQFDSDVERMALWGADNGVDRFYIEENESRLTLYGGGHGDAFHIGGLVKQDLDLLHTRVVNVVGGTGTDVIYVHDDNSTGLYNFRLRDRWVFHAPDPRGDASREFVGLWYIEATGLTVNGNAEANIFRITPSLDVSYNVNGGFPHHGDGDKLMLVGNVPDHQLLFQTSTYWFGPPNTGLPRSIRYTSINQLAEHGRVAVASTAGTAPLVEVFDEWSREKLFDIQPYSSGFIGGVQVATGSIVPGATPSIVTVPASNGFGIVRVFDGRTSGEVHSFEVFGGDHGGYDVAVGNVLGDSRHEIIVSQLQAQTFGDGNSIEIWEQSEFEGETTWILNRTFDPFANAPKIGTRISVNGDFDFDGYDDIVSGAGPGWLPQVAIHSVDQDTKQLHRFLAHDSSFQGGVFVAAANLIGNRKADVVVSFAPTDRIPAPNLIRTFRGERLFKNAGGTTLAPDIEATPFGGSNPTSLVIFDADFDERADHIFAAISDPNNSGRIKVLDSHFSQIDYFLGDEIFLNGADLG